MVFKKINRVKTYIQGFDNLIEGGFPEGSNILLEGNAGTGKTIFSLNYLYNGILKDDETCIYFSFEEKKQALIDQASLFGWDLEKLEKSNKLKIISLGIDDINKNTIDNILEIIKSTKAKRVVIDSITTISFLSSVSGNNFYEVTIKKFIYSFLSKFNEISDLTTIFISQKNQTLSNSIAEYFCDGVLDIEYESLGGDFSRNLIIKKMRKTKNNEDIHPLEISNKGIIIHNIE